MNPFRWIRDRFDSATSRMIAAARESLRPKLRSSTPQSEPLPPAPIGQSGFLKWKRTLDKPEGTDREQ